MGTRHGDTAMLLLLLCLLPLSVLPLSYIGVGATGPVGRRFIDLVGGRRATMCSFWGEMASWHLLGRVSHDYGYLGPKLMKKTGAKIRDWDNGDILDITGDTWIGWQDDVANFKGDVAIGFTGCLYDARVMAVDRLVTAFSGMGEGRTTETIHMRHAAGGDREQPKGEGKRRSCSGGGGKADRRGGERDQREDGAGPGPEDGLH